jgi:hypothetical protein
LVEIEERNRLTRQFFYRVLDSGESALIIAGIAIAEITSQKFEPSFRTHVVS